MKDMNAADWVAIILAAGISVALLVVTFSTVWAAIYRETGIGENTTQVLTGWGGGMLGVLGAYVGYRFGAKRNGTPK